MDKRSDIKTKAAKIAKKGKLTPKEVTLHNELLNYQFRRFTERSLLSIVKAIKEESRSH